MRLCGYTLTEFYYFSHNYWTAPPSDKSREFLTANLKIFPSPTVKLVQLTLTSFVLDYFYFPKGYNEYFKMHMKYTGSIFPF